MGGGGEPVDLRRSISSHGLVDLPPFRPEDEGRALVVTLPMAGVAPRTVRLTEDPVGSLAVAVEGSAPDPDQTAALLTAVRAMLRLDADLSGFYAVAAKDADLAWVTAGAGRMIRGATVFEDVAKTICTTNCAWSATRRMIEALVRDLGAPAQGAPPEGPEGRAFPTAAAMAAAAEDWYREGARAGYRGPYLRALATAVAEGLVDLESWGDASPADLPDDELEARLLLLPGVGPYAAAHVMLLLGRHSRLVLDSWTRPTYAKMVGRKSVADATIVKRFRRYREHAGLAFWLYLTRGWVEDA